MRCFPKGLFIWAGLARFGGTIFSPALHDNSQRGELIFIPTFWPTLITETYNFDHITNNIKKFLSIVCENTVYLLCFLKFEYKHVHTENASFQSFKLVEEWKLKRPHGLFFYYKHESSVITTFLVAFKNSNKAWVSSHRESNGDRQSILVG